MAEPEPEEQGPFINSLKAGPLRVKGPLRVARKTAMHSEHGEPMTWVTAPPLETRENFALCRCGHSGNKPFCDGSHVDAGFEGADTADASTYESRANVLGGTGITVSDDRSICVHAGFCGNKATNVWKQVGGTDESAVRLAVINEVEKCPSGALTYRLEGSDEDVEVDYGRQIGVIADGPYWLMGGIPVTTSEGVALETRERVTLCRCGQSANKPLCDGSHAAAGFSDS